MAVHHTQIVLDSRIDLGLFVKVVPDWRESAQKVRELDWHFQLQGLSKDQGETE